MTALEACGHDRRDQADLLDLQANSRPVWVQSEDAFYLAASNDKGATWACWQVTSAGLVNKVGAGMGDIATNGKGLALARQGQRWLQPPGLLGLCRAGRRRRSERPAVRRNGTVVLAGWVGGWSSDGLAHSRPLPRRASGSSRPTVPV